MKPIIQCSHCGFSITPEEITAGIDLACTVCEPERPASQAQQDADWQRWSQQRAREAEREES